MRPEIDAALDALNRPPPVDRGLCHHPSQLLNPCEERVDATDSWRVVWWMCSGCGIFFDHPTGIVRPRV